ncbi:MAG: FtsW/RodA/SpoVE family cell cycle protein [Verrucomicrobiota bacterium]
MTLLLRKILALNWLLVLVAVGLAVFGVVAIYSAGNNPAWENTPAAIAEAWKKQRIWIGVGLVVFFTTALIDYRWLKWVGIPMYLASVILLVVVALQGEEIGGSKAWLSIAGFSFQPSQLAIASGIILLSMIMAFLPGLHKWLVHPFIRLLVAGAFAFLPFALVLVGGGDVGSAAVWIPTTAAILLVGNCPFRYLIAIGLLAAMILPWFYYFGLSDTRKARIEDWIALRKGEEVDTQGTAYAPYNVVRAIGSAGWEGKGFLSTHSIHALGLIPKDTAINDFVFAVIAEEFGFTGGSLLILALVFLVLLCLYVAFYSGDEFGRLLVAGVVALLFMHVYQNIGMCLLQVPITGIPLPLVSYGGTFAVVIFFLLGVVQSVWIHRGGGFEAEEEIEIAPPQQYVAPGHINYGL